MPPARRALNLNALADDMPDLDRHMGCMAGIFQIFDRQRLLTAAPRGRQPRHKSLPPPHKGTTTNTIHPPPLPSSPSCMPRYIQHWHRHALLCVCRLPSSIHVLT
jgi:hypothetical protein